MTTVPFQPTGLLALEPRAFGVMVSQVKAPTRAVERIGEVAVVSIVGPLDHHKGEGYCDSYEDLTRRLTEAFNSDAAAVVLKVDSPGGLVAGCFAAALAMRAMREQSGKPLHAFVSGNACSAAYALVSQADRIVIAPAASVGSIGIIDARLDLTRADAAIGVQYAFVVSGDRKAYGNPHHPITEEELAVRQAAVDANAAVFFDIVAARRPTTAEKIKALQAGSFSGSAAIERGLADSVGTFEDLLASVASAQQPPARASTKEEPMSARKALEEAAKGDGEEAKKAKRALAAWDEKEEAKAEESDEDDKEEAKAEDKDEKKDDEKKEEAKAAALAAPPSSASSAGSNDRLSAIEATQRNMLIDARSDLTAEQRAFAAGLPVEKVQAYLGTIAKTPKPKHAAAAAPAATRAEGQDSNGGVSQLPPAQKAALDAQMGLSAITYTGVESTPLKVVLGAPVPVKREAKVG